MTRVLLVCLSHVASRCLLPVCPPRVSHHATAWARGLTSVSPNRQLRWLFGQGTQPLCLCSPALCCSAVKRSGTAQGVCRSSAGDPLGGRSLSLHVPDVTSLAQTSATLQGRGDGCQCRPVAFPGLLLFVASCQQHRNAPCTNTAVSCWVLAATSPMERPEYFSWEIFWMGE